MGDASAGCYPGRVVTVTVARRTHSTAGYLDSSMRITVATDQWSPDVVGGSGRVATATAELFARHGHDVTVVAPRVADLPRYEQRDKLELYRVLRRLPLPQTFADVLETRSWALPRTTPDVFVAHQATNAVGLHLSHRDVPLVYVFHASVPLEQRFARRYMSLPRRSAATVLDPVFVLLEALAVRSATRIVVLSEYSRTLLLSRFPSARDRTVLARGGVEISRFANGEPVQIRRRYAIPDDRPFVLTVRRLAPRMGIEELLRAVKLLVSAGQDITLGIAGSGKSDRELRVLTASLGIDDHVRFFGRVPDEDLPGLYAAADLFVLPTVAYEGFGMATVEALAAGTPVVGTTVGATPEILRALDARLLSPTASPSDLARTIQLALARTSPALRAECAAYADANYNWQKTIGEWLVALDVAPDPGSPER